MPMGLMKLGEHRSTVQSKEHTSGSRSAWRPYRYVRPWVSLSAKWLADAGFAEGDSIVIHSYAGRLVIEKNTEETKHE
jgi:hypothetical protein